MASSNDLKVLTATLNEWTRRREERYSSGPRDRIGAIYEPREFQTRRWPAQWSANGETLTRVETGECGQRELVTYDTASGRRTLVVTSSQLVADVMNTNRSS